MTPTPEFTTDNWSDLDIAETFLDIVDRAKVIKYLALEAEESRSREVFLLGIRVLADDIWAAAENGDEKVTDRIREDIGNPDWRRNAA